ncbi:hypothetical protein SAMN05192575_103126 [Nocardioides alpinus]|uniref:Uncharacterized protein n=1 Tax=Nocardioides alpinus TaxID=748909 RepID=A0A1I0XYP7_9ACTN|nr:hypothetical protein [Nocardioides alpinus]SFB06034.1 hypothetical protein SAMN05192575_103126 [Nocardioides alpinus]
MVTVPPTILEPFLAAADEAAQQRDDVDQDVARELMEEAATMLHNSLALDDLDEHDLAVVVAGLSRALVAPDPTEAVRALPDAVSDQDVHDPAGVQAAYVVAASVLQL